MKFAQLLKALRPEEHKDFEKFLQSPYFKSSEQYQKFFKFLCKHHPSFEFEKNEAKQAYLHCFGAASYTDGKLYNLLSGMTKQLEQFLVVQTVLGPLTKDDRSYDQFLVKALGQRNMGGYFRTEAETFIRDTGSLSVKQADHFLALYETNQKVYFNPDTPKTSTHQPWLHDAALHLNLFYCIASLRLQSEMKTRSFIYGEEDTEMPLLQATLDYSKSSGLLDEHPILDIYYRIVCLYQGKVDEAGFHELATLFHARFKSFPVIDQPILLRHLINCGLPLLVRDFEIETDLLSLYKLSIKENMLMSNNRMTHFAFINIIHLGCFCREFDWTRSFMDKYVPYLEDEKRQISSDMAEACLAYAQGHYQRAIHFVSVEQFYVPGFDIFSKMLLTKINFDRFILFGEEYEFLQSHLNAFEKYIYNKQQFTPEKRTAQLNCIRFIRKMLTARLGHIKLPEQEKEELRTRLSKISPVVNRRWLKERIELL